MPRGDRVLSVVLGRRWRHLLPALLLCWTATLVNVERVVDGDTFEAEVQVWPRLTLTERVRLLGVDTPERADLDAWKAARSFTDAWLKAAGATTVTVCRYDNFGRVLGSVRSVTHGDLSAALILAGHGAVYPSAPLGKERKGE